MSTRMKIIIAYDGSDHADAAIDDLQRAGLPPESDVMVVSIADFSKTSIANSYELGVLGKYVSTRLLEETIACTQREKTSIRNDAKKQATQGAQRVLSNLPGLRVRNQTAIGNPAAALLKMANESKPDLIVLGSHGRSAIGRFFLGSVSQEVAEGASCSVRVVRNGLEKKTNKPNKIILGASSLPDAEEVIRAAGKRVWSEDTQIRLVIADDGISPGRVSAVYPYAKAIFEQAVEELQHSGREVSVDIKSGNTQSILLEEAESWKADSIFVFNVMGNEEKGLSDLAANLITSAKCTVELVKKTGFK